VSGSYVSTTLGTAVSGTNGSLSATIPEAFYDGSVNCHLSDTNLSAANIAAGASIFGISGQATSPASNNFRTVGSTPVSQYAESTTYAGIDLPGNYNDVPIIENDDDGQTGSGSVITPALRPTVQCGGNASATCGGNPAGSIAAQICNCATLNGARATWNGTTNANGGQATWLLVSYLGTNPVSTQNAEVWKDGKTGLFWSSYVSNSSNWCVAAGNAQATDPHSICNNTSYQPYFVNGAGNKAESDCAETTTEANTVTIPSKASEAISTTLGNGWSGVYSIAKGGMGASNSVGANIRWRLPNLYDYEQAVIDGIHFVVPDIGINDTHTYYQWTGTVGGGVSSAWAYYPYYNEFGTMFLTFSASTRSTSQAVRCVGR
jgi:hypothetical protein